MRFRMETDGHRILITAATAVIHFLADVKHNRYEQLKQAKQENVLNILGALYLIEMLYLKKITDGTDEFDVFDESSNLFSLKNWTSKAVPLSQAFAVLSDMMDDENNTTNKKFDA